MMSRDQVRKNSAARVCHESRNRVESARSRMIHPARFALDMGFRVVTARGLDIALEFRAVFAQVMPQPGKPCPIRTPKLLPTRSRKLSNTSQILVQWMFVP